MMKEEDNSEGRFYFHFLSVPAEAFLNPSLTQTDMFLFALIKNMSGTPKGCWASNGYFADILRIGKRTISGSISRLESEGYIYLSTNKYIKRRIYIDLSYKDRYFSLVELFNKAYVDNNESSRKEYIKYADLETKK